VFSVPLQLLCSPFWPMPPLPPVGDCFLGPCGHGASVPTSLSSVSWRCRPVGMALDSPSPLCRDGLTFCFQECAVCADMVHSCHICVSVTFKKYLTGRGWLWVTAAVVSEL
jgi:hypothetical protein